MKTKFTTPLLAMFVLLVIACACPFTLPSATPTPQVIYRSPDDMNIQPGDIPDLKETPIENPATKKLLPEAEDQSQRAFKDSKRDIYVETNVILVSDPSKRSYDDIYEHTVSQRRPNSHRSSGDKRVNISEQGYLIPFSDKTCGEGLVLILIRSNVIMVIIACGENVDEEYVVNIGKIMDERVQAPPEEIGIEDKPPGLGGEEQCAGLDLSLEECANAGTHTYFHREIANTCNALPSEPINVQVAITFFQGGVEMRNLNDDTTATYTKIATNTYTGEWSNEIETITYTITFTLSGFKLHGHSSAPARNCDWEWEATRQ